MRLVLTMDDIAANLKSAARKLLYSDPKEVPENVKTDLLKLSDMLPDITRRLIRHRGVHIDQALEHLDKHTERTSYGILTGHPLERINGYLMQCPGEVIDPSGRNLPSLIEDRPAIDVHVLLPDGRQGLVCAKLKDAPQRGDIDVLMVQQPASQPGSLSRAEQLNDPCDRSYSVLGETFSQEPNIAGLGG